MLKLTLAAALAILAAPALADAPAQQRVEAELAKAPPGVRFGVLAVDETGREVVAINPDGRFIPASNTKLFTTAAAYAALPGMDQPDAAGGTAVALVPGRAGAGADVWLIGRGDARMSSAPDCAADCLAELADAVAARTRRVRDVVGDDRAWPDQRWSPGMGWNNIGTDSGTAISALNLDDNQLAIAVTPAAVGKAPTVVVPPYFKLRNEAVTVAAGGTLALALERPVNGMELRLYGQIPADAKAWRAVVGVDDPAHFAAWTLKRMLAARGVTVTGTVRAMHRAVGLLDSPRNAPDSGADSGAGPAVSATATLARLVPPPLADDVVTINKRSQNLHAQALFRRLGTIRGTGSDGWAAQALGEALAVAGLPRASYDFADGSGMSTYNRVSPRAVVALLRWGAGQPWGNAWRASFPVGGVDGTLARRFAGTPLQGRVWAKTGTINGANALSGFVRTAGGHELAFSILANDLPGGTSAAAAIDGVLQAIAASD